jgi:uncharacterized protein
MKTRHISSVCGTLLLLAAALPALAESPVVDPARAATGNSAAARNSHGKSLPQNRLIMQVSDDDPSIWRQAFSNAKNVQKSFGAKNVAIEIVIQGNGIGAARFDSVVNDKVSELIAAGIDVAVCDNTMKARNISREDMHDKVRYVTAGVVEIMRRQQAGWTYIKP